MFAVRCWEQPARSIYFSTRPLPPCRPSGPVPTVAVQPLRGAVPASWVRTGLGRLAAWRPPSRLADGRVRDVPALGVEITLRGTAGAVARTAGPSALHTVIATRLPVPVPSGWRPVSFDGFVVDVPPAWPVVRIDERNVLQEVPICGGVMRAKVALGGVSVVIDCPAISAQSMLSTTTPGSGLWLGGTTSVSQWVALTQAEAFRTVTLRSGAVTVIVGTQDVGGSGDVEGIVTAGGRALTFELGTGVDPLMAEEVLSSLRPAGAR